MNDLDHLEIRNDDDPDAEESRPASSALWFGLAGVLLVAAGLVAWFFWPRGEEAPAVAADPPPAGAVDDGWQQVEEEEPAADPALPPLDESDPLVRELVGALSSHPNLAAWLVNDDLAERFTRMVANVAYGEDPRAHAPFVRPSGKFTVTEGGEGAVVIDPASYARYDLVADVVTSLDTEGSVRLYRRLLPLFQKSYQELGMPGDFRDALRRAVARILETPTVPGEIVLREETLAYRYADPELEALSPAQKLLLRSGSRNVARIKAKVREIADAAGLL